jgi:hypothetical protein
MKDNKSFGMTHQSMLQTNMKQLYRKYVLVCHLFVYNVVYFSFRVRSPSGFGPTSFADGILLCDLVARIHHAQATGILI